MQPISVFSPCNPAWPTRATCVCCAGWFPCSGNIHQMWYEIITSKIVSTGLFFPKTNTEVRTVCFGASVPTPRGGVRDQTLSYFPTWLVRGFFVSVEVKAVFEKVFIETLILFNFLKEKYLVIFVCYSCKLGHFWGLIIIIPWPSDELGVELWSCWKIF